jgi:hypothetical protein
MERSSTEFPAFCWMDCAVTGSRIVADEPADVSLQAAMSQTFDYDGFVRRSSTVIVHSKGKSFAQLAGEIEALRQEYEGIRDRSARKYIRRTLDRLLLIVAIETSQPRVVVERLYKRNVRRGFNDLHAEVASAIDYAHYCSERDDAAKGLRALHRVREAIAAGEGISPGFLQAIEKSIRFLEKNR